MSFVVARESMVSPNRARSMATVLLSCQGDGQAAFRTIGLAESNRLRLAFVLGTDREAGPDAPVLSVWNNERGRGESRH